MLTQQNQDSTESSDSRKGEGTTQYLSFSAFSAVPQAVPDPILAMAAGYRADQHPDKVNLAIGAYRCELGKPYVFPVVRQAERELVAGELDKEYQPIDGNQDFLTGARGVLLGWDHEDVSSGRVVSAQTLSGTGAVRVICEFLKKSRDHPIYVSRPTWANHVPVMKAAGLETREYRYFDPETRGLDIEGMIADLAAAETGSTVLLHTCAHNPTGVDPTMDEWKRIADVCEARGLFPFFDTAYQGFVSGDLDIDGAALRYFISRGFEMVSAQSFSKIMGLYGERCGAAHFILNDVSLVPNVRE
jgi:aspartate/tyrosine/aromatic aminotransferase